MPLQLLRASLLTVRLFLAFPLHSVSWLDQSHVKRTIAKYNQEVSSWLPQGSTHTRSPCVVDIC